MGRKKKQPKIEDFPEVAELFVKCASREQGAITALGEYVEWVLKGKFGKVLEIYFRGKESEILSRAKQDLTNSQFYLGMLGAVKEFTLDLEQFVLDKDKVNAPLESENGMQETEAP